MIEKYFDGLIRQVYSRVGTENNNIVMARYSNEFFVSAMECTKRYLEDLDNVFFSCCELDAHQTVGAYEPFLDLVCQMFTKYGEGTFEEFMDSCGVYELHKEIFRSYFETGRCKRREKVILNEVGYERHRMTQAMAVMLTALAEIHPFMLVINQFQFVSKNTQELVLQLIQKPSKNIALILCVNEMPKDGEDSGSCWGQMMEALEDASHVYHIGSSAKYQKECEGSSDERENLEKLLLKISNMVELFDYEQALFYLGKLDKQIRFEDRIVEGTAKWDFYLLYIRVSILNGNMPGASELIDEFHRTVKKNKDLRLDYFCTYYRGISSMYQGLLTNGYQYANEAKRIASTLQDEKLLFEAELLEVQNKMAGWYRVFFCAQNVPIEDAFLEKLEKYGYWNHLAHVYIYAYDNLPEMLSKAYENENALVGFSKGFTLAKKIGNEQLVYHALQKNIMIASTNGMHEIAMLYLIRSYQALGNKNSLEGGRIYSAIGYNLSALGYNEEANMYYRYSMDLFYRLKLPEDIAEVQYNMALNYIMIRDYARAEQELLVVFKTVERLHLNSLRVCNLSKLYSLMALICILQKDRFGCERYLEKCRQFLDYILEKRKKGNQVGIIHDYAKVDDDMFLYTFSRGLLSELEQDEERAFQYYQEAEDYFMNAQGNQFYAYCIFREKRMALFEKRQDMALYEWEREQLNEHLKQRGQSCHLNALKELKKIENKNFLTGSHVTVDMVDTLVKQEGIVRDLYTKRSQMDFISSWQKLIDVNDVEIPEMVNRAVEVFLNHFNNDCAIYIRYHKKENQILYNNTGIEITEHVMQSIVLHTKRYPQGIAVSKIDGCFLEHQELISKFGEEEVCSIVTAPFFRNNKLESVLITYNRMRDNWHSNTERYMLNEDDRNLYQLLFREMGYSINRMEAYRKVYEMNKKLEAAAVTDVLTGIYNRAGMYREIEKMVSKIPSQQKVKKMGLMFIDLDNFKHYNDTFGHDIGDVVLKSMAEIFVSAAGNKGFVSRFGGDEFIIVLETNEQEELEAIAKEIYDKIRAANGFVEAISKTTGQSVVIDERLRITCSIGIAASKQIQEEKDVEELIQKADDLLYKVKMGQKGTYAFI